MVLGAGVCPAMVHSDFEQKYFNDPGYPVLDHFLLEEDGVYHLFYLRGNPAVSIGHATSDDLIHWNYETPLLSPGPWDTKAMWAPHLVRAKGSWWMFYTGVTLENSQLSGVAIGSSLYDWFKFPFPLYHPSTSWAEWTSTGFAHGRDPHVIEHDGRYYMFVTAKTWTNKGAVAGAVSDDLINWADIGPIFVNTTWHVLESVFIMQRNDKWHMFFTEETINGTSHMWSDSLLTGWDLANRRVIDVGHAPQISPMADGTEIFSRHLVYNDNHGELLYNLRFDTLTWIGDIPAPVKPIAPLEWNVVQGGAFALQPTFKDNAYVRTGSPHPGFVGDSWINTYESYTGPMGFGAPGQFQGDGATGIIQSAPFIIEGNSFSLLVGGGDYPGECYVALKDAGTDEVLFSETGRGTETMDRRYWDVRNHVGRTCYIEVADLSTAVMGHINVDDIIESGSNVSDEVGDGNSKARSRLNPTAQRGFVTHLGQNTPNPFNPSTTIPFELATEARVQLAVFDVAGRRVQTLVDTRLAPGTHRVEWSGPAQAGAARSGVYFYRLRVDGRVVETRKMVLVE
jgi:hypothetical protein